MCFSLVFCLVGGWFVLWCGGCSCFFGWVRDFTAFAQRFRAARGNQGPIWQKRYTMKEIGFALLYVSTATSFHLRLGPGSARFSSGVAQHGVHRRGIQVDRFLRCSRPRRPGCCTGCGPGTSDRVAADDRKIILAQCIVQAEILSCRRQGNQSRLLRRTQDGFAWHGPLCGDKETP